MKITEIQCKSILTKSNLPEADYCINPYVGCLHGCAYCYASFMKRFTGHTEEWGTFLDVKINAPVILEKQLTPKKKRGTILIGSVTDAYQPIERKYEITRNILKILAKHEFPVSILTKSALVKRDIDIIKKIKSCEVGMTITSLNKSISRIFEPTASSPQERLDTLSFFKNNGIRTYAFIGPILPEIIDINEILQSVKDKVDFVMFETLNFTKANRDKIIKCYKKAGINVNIALFDRKKFEKEALKLCHNKKIVVKGFYKH
ncbi:radical SAM protein [Candidatus Parcubacteria bacterium]|nr:radical SAM protein [Candidatus Parcubacteria bacterium]